MAKVILGSPLSPELDRNRALTGAEQLATILNEASPLAFTHVNGLDRSILITNSSMDISGNNFEYEADRSGLGGSKYLMITKYGVFLINAMKDSSTSAIPEMEPIVIDKMVNLAEGLLVGFTPNPDKPFIGQYAAIGDKGVEFSVIPLTTQFPDHRRAIKNMREQVEAKQSRIRIEGNTNFPIDPNLANEC